jgi:GNAT superfamily N-acetyltransferase
MQGTQSLAVDAPVEWQRDGFVVSTHRARLDLHSAHEFLAQSSYWAKQIPFETFARSVENSLCFGVYDSAGVQVGFARVISDFATFAYVADVFVLDSYQGRGLGKLLMGCIKGHPQLQSLRRWVLTTRDAHSLYAQFGFTSPKFPERFMEILRPNMYEAL